jgi:aminopeptidase N
MLGNQVLKYLSQVDSGQHSAAQFANADNMTQQQAALSYLLMIGKGQAQTVAFYDQWRDDRLVMDKWFRLQIGNAAPDRAVTITRELTTHPQFDWQNPNRFRAVFGALAGHPAGFHDPSGAGYDLLADWLIKLDPVNPQTTAVMAKRFDSWPQFGPERQAQMRAALGRIAAADGLSRDTTEIVMRILG